MFLESDDLKRFNSIHCVNLAQGFKEPVIYYQRRPERRYLDAVKKGFSDLALLHGQPQGMYGADEGLHGGDPTQGSEACAAVEMMFSLEQMMGITGDVAFADRLERVAFNALPTQVTDDFMYKQYFQQPNQVMATRHTRNFYEDAVHADRRGLRHALGIPLLLFEHAPGMAEIRAAPLVRHARQRGRRADLLAFGGDAARGRRPDGHDRRADRLPDGGGDPLLGPDGGPRRRALSFPPPAFPGGAKAPKWR